MAQIKSYSDLQQSEKLAKILPLESADMYYWCADHYPKEDWIIEVGAPDDNYECICAWSLAALLGMLPKRIEIVDNVYELSVYFYGLYYWNTINGNLCFESKDTDNLVGACYELILKLHELNLL